MKSIAISAPIAHSHALCCLIRNNMRATDTFTQVMDHTHSGKQMKLIRNAFCMADGLT